MIRHRAIRRVLPLLLLAGVVGCADGQAEGSSPSARELYDQGLALETRRLGADDFRAALSLYERAVEADPDFALGHAGLARVHAGMVHFAYEPTPEHRARALEEAETALRLAPDDGEAHFAMGTYWYFAQKDYARAAAEFEIASESMPGDADVRAMAGYLARRRGEWDEALAYLERAAAIDPEDAGILVNLADTYEAFGRVDDAVARLSAADRLQPAGHFDVNRGLVILRATGAADSLRAALARAPSGFDPDGLITLARYELAWQTRSPAAALEALAGTDREVLSGQNSYWPRSLLAARAHRLAGDAARARAAFDSAKTILERELAAAPDDARMHVALGSALAGLGQSSAALREAERALELMPRTRDALIAQAIERYAAAVCADAGQQDRAIELLQSVFRERVFAYPRRLLAVDPTWDTLRRRADFQRLLGS